MNLLLYIKQVLENAYLNNLNKISLENDKYR